MCDPQAAWLSGGERSRVAEVAKRNEVNHGIIFKPTKTLYADYLLEWNENRRNLRESTKHTYTRMIKNHINPILGRTMLSELNSMGVEIIMMHRLHLAFLLALHCCLRRGEILGLRIQNVDFENNRISIRNIINYKGQLQSGAKTDCGVRTVDIFNRVANQIRLRIQSIESETEKYGDSYHRFYGLQKKGTHSNGLWVESLYY